MAKLKRFEQTRKYKRMDSNKHQSNYRIIGDKDNRFKVVRRMIRNKVKVAVVEFLSFNKDIDFIWEHRHNVLAGTDYS